MNTPELTDADRAAIREAQKTFPISESLSWNDHLFRAGLAAGRARAIEECAKVAAPYGKRPCDCERCDCMNIGDAQNVAAWDAETACAAAIRALK